MPKALQVPDTPSETKNLPPAKRRRERAKKFVSSKQKGKAHQVSIAEGGGYKVEGLKAMRVVGGSE